jgi:hypothetical protein
VTVRGEDVDRLVVSIPVPARSHASATELGNQVVVIPVTLPVTGEPVRRLAAVARITRQRQTVAPGSSAALIGPVCGSSDDRVPTVARRATTGSASAISFRCMSVVSV